MSVYCALKCSHSVEAHNHERYLIQLTLKNPNEEPESMEWQVRIPPEVATVRPHIPLTGTNLLQPGTHEIVGSWRIDVSKIPVQNRPAILERCRVHADVTITPLGAKDSCQTRISI